MSWENRPYPQPARTSSWGIITATAVATFILLCLVVPIVDDEASGAYRVGQIFGIILMTWLIVGVTAHATKGRWPRWVAPIAVVGLAVGLTVMSFLPGSIKASDDGAAAVPAGQSRSLAAHDKLAGWRMSSKADQAAFSAALDTLAQDMADQGDVVGGMYRSGADRMMFVGVNVEDGSGLAEDLHDDAKSALADYVDGMMDVKGSALADPGDLGGFMSCGSVTAPTGGAGAVACTWVDEDTVGTVILPGESPVTAREITRTVRKAATTVSD